MARLSTAMGRIQYESGGARRLPTLYGYKLLDIIPAPFNRDLGSHWVINQQFAATHELKQVLSRLRKWTVPGSWTQTRR